MKKDWRKPFLTLKSELKPLEAANLSIYHAVLASTNRTEPELQPVIEMLEPAYRKNLMKSIPVQTEGCTYHGHLFFADDRRGLDQLGRLLDGIEEWMDEIPGGFVPAFDIPADRNQTHRNTLRWVSLVYHLAWASEAVYLDAELEYQTSVDRIGFFPWEECPQPPGCLPFQWLIHQGVSSNRVPKWKQKFEDYGERIPDVIDAYLTDEFIKSSLMAIDILVYVLNGERRLEAVEKEADDKRPKADRPRTRKVQREVKLLQNFLAGWHNPNRPEPAEGKGDDDWEPLKPLTAFQIAEKLGWITPQGRLDQSKVSRRMEVIYGPDPMAKYAATFFDPNAADRHATRLRDGTSAGERFINPEEIDFD